VLELEAGTTTSLVPSLKNVYSLPE
jgi:hypothetical protein